MTRKKAELIIANCLTLIQAIADEYIPDFDICSMYVTKNSRSAFITDDKNGEYLLRIDERDGEEE